jgi:acyl carrier protein
MTFKDIENRVNKILVDKLGIDREEITYDASFTNDFGADSLDTIELIMEMEKEFNVSIPDEVAEKLGPTLGEAYENFFKNAPRDFIAHIKSQVLCFRFNEKGKIEVVLRLEDGSWTYADGVSKLPSSICVINFTKWTNILKELEDIINDPKSKENDLQIFFETYPELIAGNDYDVVLPQAVIVRDDKTEWETRLCFDT